MLDIQFWQKYFQVYDVLNELKPYDDLLETITQKLYTQQGDLILDAGAGTGNLAMKLVKNGARVTAFDSSEVGLKIYKTKNPNAINVTGDLLKPLPFAENSFDKICSNNTLYTLPREQRMSVMREFYRILKPGGLIVISNLTESFSPSKIYSNHFVWEFNNHRVGAIFRFFKFLIPTIKIFYYNSLIKRENKTGAYDFFKKGEQGELLASAGFKEISLDEKVYAGQGIINVAKK